VITTFVPTVEEINLPAKACSELMRIVQEALTNVRKHAAARHVRIGLSAENGAFHLVVDDDGRGFGFSGRLSQIELDQSRRGPLVIKERVQALGGQLEVESDPGRGSRLEITMPRRIHA
jgi:signal transduction histidine kinase